MMHNQVFVMEAFLPAIRKASSHHYLGLTDRLDYRYKNQNINT